MAFLVMRGEPLDDDDEAAARGRATPTTPEAEAEEVPLLRRDYRQLDELLARLRGSH